MNTRKDLKKFDSIDTIDPYHAAWLAKLNINKKLYDKLPCFFSETEKFIWIGKLVDNLPHGSGLLLSFIPNRVISIVSFDKGLREGSASIFWEDGTQFEVNYARDAMQGNVTALNSSKQPLFKANLKEGSQAEIQYDNGQVYIGEHAYLFRESQGKLYSNKALSVENLLNSGQWQGNKFIKGFAKLDFYAGEIFNDKYEGQGTLFYDKERKRKHYIGQFKSGVFHGLGTEYFDSQNEDIKYQGSFENGVYSGEGILKSLENSQQQSFKGIFADGKPSDDVAIYDKHGKIVQKVGFDKGKAKTVYAEYFYDIQIPCILDISPEEIKVGQIDKINVKTVVYNYKAGTIKYFRDPESTPNYLVQIDQMKFPKTYEGIFQEGGALVYMGEMNTIYFEGKGCLRYNIKGEPKKYEGQFKKSLFNGKGTLYYASGKQVYCGEFLDNQFHGKGVLKIHLLHIVGDYPVIDNSILPLVTTLEEYDIEIDGSFVNGRFQGGIWRFTGLNGRVYGRTFTLQASSNTDVLDGKLFEGNHLVYDGHFEKFQFNGKGTLYYVGSNQKKYVGGFREGSFEGQGELYNEKGELIYAGNFLNGVFQGQGKLCIGIRGPVYYEGEFQNGHINGKGRLVEKSGNKVRSEGTFQKGELIEGQTRNYDEANNLVYEGCVLKGLFEGLGTVYTKKGEIAMKGTFKEGILIDGTKKEFFSNGVLFKEGNVINGQYEGKVKEYFFDGKVFYDGEYKNNDKHGQGTVFHRNGKIKQSGLFREGGFLEGQCLLYYEDSIVVRFEGLVKDTCYEGPGKRYYQDGKLEYEGNFSKGYSDGEGIYYYPDGKVKFKGQFAAGVPDGPGGYFNTEGKKIYVGGMVNWKKHGTGTLFSSTGEKLQEGEFRDDEFFKGTGKQYWPGYGTLKYEGEYDNGYIEGKGKLYFTNGNIEYEGTFKSGKFAGQGVLYSENEQGVKVYQGGFFKGVFGGQGTLFGKDETYVGEFKFGKKHGQGVVKYNNAFGVKYEGKFENDLFDEGWVVLRDQYGKVYYEGNVKREQYHGKGKLLYNNGAVCYDGEFANGAYEGQGTLHTQGGDLEYEGGFAQGKYNGTGKLYRTNDPKGVIYEGGFIEGIYEGQGTLFDVDGKIVYIGEFKKGVYSGNGTLYFKGSAKVKYTGQFENGEFNGFGEKISKKGYKKYVGRFTNGKFDGEGILNYPNGAKKYVGNFKMKKYHKDGILTDQNNNFIYKGGFNEGKYHGFGYLFYQDPPNNKVYYEGDFVEGVMEGKGTFRFDNGVPKYIGGIKNGIYHSKGILYLENAMVLCESIFTNGNCEHGMHHN